MRVSLIIPDGSGLTYQSGTPFDSANQRNPVAPMRLWLLRLVREGKLILIIYLFKKVFFGMHSSKVNRYSCTVTTLSADLKQAAVRM